jgi:membrane protease YdiL (CAAX protease family)
MEYIKRFFIVIGLFLLSQIGMFTYGTLKQSSLQVGQGTMPLLSTLILIVIFIMNIGLLLVLANKLELLNFDSKFLNKKNILIIVIGVVIARLVAILGTILLNNQGIDSTALNDAAINNLFTGENPLLIILILGISAPIMEEIVFRAGIIGYFLKDWPILGIALSSISFGLVHGPTDIISFFMYALIGLVLSIAYFKTSRLEVSILIHFFNNLIPAIVIAFGLI